jgi:hypothetical protein
LNKKKCKGVTPGDVTLFIFIPLLTKIFIEPLDLLTQNDYQPKKFHQMFVKTFLHGLIFSAWHVSKKESFNFP